MFKKAVGFFAYFAPPPLNKWMHKFRGVNIHEPKTVWIGANCHIDSKYPEYIEIGSHVTISFGVKIFAHMDPPDTMQERFLPAYQKKVKIGANSFIGAGACILPGVTIGEWVIIGAGAVVTKSVEDYTIMGGNPAQKIGDIRSLTNGANS